MSIASQPGFEARERRRRSPSRATSLAFRGMVPLVIDDAWALGESLRRCDEPLVLWQKGDLSFAAVGRAFEECFKGPDRFKHADAWMTSVRERLLPFREAEVPRDLPLFIGAFAFDPSPEPRSDEAWTGWPRSVCRVPRLLVVRRGKDTGIILTESISPGRIPRSALAHLREMATEAIEARVSTKAPQGTPPLALDGDDTHLEAWGAGFNQAMDAIKCPNGALAKVVLSRRAAFRSSGAGDGLAPAFRLRAGFSGSAVYCFDQGGGEQFLGATPELLASKRGQSLETVALAGTAPLVGDTSTGLESNKNQREQAFVQNAIEASLRPLTTDLRSARTAETLGHGNVAHLQSAISATLLPHTTLLGTIDRLHPTPAVAGEPRQEALDFIAAHETHDRGWYAGPVGWVDAAGDGAFYVALRCLRISGGKAWAFSGAGLLEGSELMSEFVETSHKLHAAKTALDAAGDPSSNA